MLFHCNVLHASGHNLSADDRWHIYVSCNTVANKPQLGPDARPDWVVSRNWKPLPIEDDEGVLKDRILSEIRAFVGDAGQQDDMTMVILKVV